MSKELQAKLRSKESRRLAIYEDIESLKVNYNKTTKDIAELNAKIADEAKPKLRHGDYGRLHSTVNDHAFGIALSVGGKLSFYDTSTKLPYSTDVKNRKATIFSNIFDDLKARQEDVTKFEISTDKSPKYQTFASNLCCEVEEDLVSIKIQGDFTANLLWLDATGLKKLILGLQQIQATDERKQAKES